MCGVRGCLTTCVSVRWWGLLMVASGFAASIVFDVGHHQWQ
jgi:hypothetical protein